MSSDISQQQHKHSDVDVPVMGKHKLFYRLNKRAVTETKKVSPELTLHLDKNNFIVALETYGSSNLAAFLKEHPISDAAAIRILETLPSFQETNTNETTAAMLHVLTTRCDITDDHLRKLLAIGSVSYAGLKNNYSTRVPQDVKVNLDNIYDTCIKNIGQPPPDPRKLYAKRPRSQTMGISNFRLSLGLGPIPDRPAFKNYEIVTIFREDLNLWVAMNAETATSIRTAELERVHPKILAAILDAENIDNDDDLTLTFL